MARRNGGELLTISGEDFFAVGRVMRPFLNDRLGRRTPLGDEFGRRRNERLVGQAFDEAIAEGLQTIPEFPQLATLAFTRELIEDRFRIQLNDLLSEETNRQIAALAPLDIPVQAPNCAWFIDRVSLYEASMETLIALVSNGAYWGDASQASFWCRAIVRVLGTGLPPSGNSVAVALRRYRPACSCTPPGLRPLPTESTGC